MTDDRPGTDGISATRRGVLAATAGVALAGCGTILGDSEPATIDGAAISNLVAGEPITVSETLPVAIADAHLNAARDRAEQLLGVVPSTLGSQEIPNGAIREEIRGFREDARSALERAGSVPTDAERLDALRDARGDARAAAAGWRAIDADLTRADLLASAPDIERDLSEFRERWRYAGDDPVRAVLVHAAIEDLQTRADYVTELDSRERSGVGENPVSIGELAADLEVARASVGDAAHLYEQFAASLSERRDLAATIAGARDELAGDIERKRDALPGNPEEPNSLVNVDVTDSPAGEALRELGYWIEFGDIDERRRAEAVLVAAKSLAAVRALDALASAIEEGERFGVTSVEEFRTTRADAIEAFESARSDARYPDLARSLLHDLQYNLRRADGQLEGYDESVEVTRLTEEIGLYVSATYLARAVPGVTRTVASSLSEE